MILAIDFDGTLHDPTRRVGNYKMGITIPGAATAMKMLKDKGHTLIIHTIHAKNPQEVQAVEDWLKYFKIPYDKITSLKPEADMYIDDKALKFVDWGEVLKEVASASR